MQPLGLSLDFLFGRGYLAARDRALSEWASLELLRMEIPDLSFPFDARGGVERFRNTRCHLRQVQLTVSESGFQGLLRRAMGHVQGFDELQVRFEDGSAHVAVRYRNLGNDARITMRAAVLPPEPQRSDAVHIIIYDVRSYGPLPYPARLLVSELVSQLLGSPPLQRLGAGPLFGVAHRGDLLELHPLRMALMAMFPARGWKIPDLGGLRYESISLRPGGLHLSARAEADPWPARALHEVLDVQAPGRGAARAIAAYEARDLCRHADERLWGGELDNALESLRGLQARYGLHPAVTSRALDVLLGAPGAGHMAEARALQQAMLRADPDDLWALGAGPSLALLRGDMRGAVEAFGALAKALRERGEKEELQACLLSQAAVQRRFDAVGAEQALREVTRVAPRSRGALELLRELYGAAEKAEEQIEVLRQLSGLLGDREQLLELYEQLADLLMRRKGDLGEARLYLEKVLQLDPHRTSALCALGESHLLDQQPLRAVSTFGAAARSAEQRGEVALAASLHVRVAGLWSQALGDANGALLAARRALHLMPRHEEALQLALDLALGEERYDEALEFSEALLPLREAALSEGGTEQRRAALGAARGAYLQAAQVAVGRGRPDSASVHHRRALELRRSPEFGVGPFPDPSVEFLDGYYRQMGRPEDLLELYRGELAQEVSLPPSRRAELHRRLATIYEQVLGLVSDAVLQLRKALELEPDSEAAIEQLVGALSREQRFFELRDQLRALVERATERRTRGLLLMRLGEVHLRHLRDPKQAAEQLRQAMLLRPADPWLAERLVEAERALRLEDPRVDSKPLLRALERWGELAMRDEQRRAALVEAGDLCYTGLQNATLAADFYRRAESYGADPHTSARLRKIHEESGYKAQGVEPAKAAPAVSAPAPVAAPAASAPVVSAPVVSAGLPEAGRAGFGAGGGTGRVPRPFAGGPKLPPPTPYHEEDEPPLEVAQLLSFRERFQAMLARPALLEESAGLLKKLGAAPVEGAEGFPLTEGDLFPSAPTPSPDRAGGGERSVSPDRGAPLADRGVALEPGRARSPEPAPEGPATAQVRPEDAQGGEVEVSLPRSAGEGSGSLGRGGERTVVVSARPQDVLAVVRAARESGDPLQLRDALEAALHRADLEPGLRAQFSRELGMLYYYDLEEVETAESWLRVAVEADPQGAGADFDVLTALEGIYGDLDDPERLLGVYERKRDSAGDLPMRQVYAVLAAELLAERLGRPEEAGRELDGVLSREPRHLPARRMKAELAAKAGRLEESAARWRELVGEHAPGSFDLQEDLRDLGKVLLARIEALEDEGASPGALEAKRREAVEVFRRLLTETSGDSGALSALKGLYTSLGEPREGLALLGMELELLLGRRGAFSGGPDPDEVRVEEVPEPLRVPISQILHEAAGLLDEDERGRAERLLDQALDLWPENVDALSLRLDLGRERLARPVGPMPDERVEVYASDLEAMAGMLLDPLDRLQALREAAQARLERLKQREKAIALLEEALVLSADLGEAPAGEYAQIREQLRSLQDARDAEVLAQLIDPGSSGEGGEPSPPSHSGRLGRAWQPEGEASVHEALTQKVPSIPRMQARPKGPTPRPEGEQDSGESPLVEALSRANIPALARPAQGGPAVAPPSLGASGWEEPEDGSPEVDLGGVELGEGDLGEGEAGPLDETALLEPPPVFSMSFRRQEREGTRLSSQPPSLTKRAPAPPSANPFGLPQRAAPPQSEAPLGPGGAGPSESLPSPSELSPSAAESGAGGRGLGALEPWSSFLAEGASVGAELVPLESQSPESAMGTPASPSVDALTGALERFERAGRRQDREAMLGALEEALRLLPEDAMMSRPLRRQLLVRKAELLLGSRAGSSAADTLAGEAVQGALGAAQEALRIGDVEEPEAYLLAALAQQALGRYAESADVLVRLAVDAEGWAEDLLAVEDGLEMEERIVDAMLGVLAQSQAPAAWKSQVLARLRAANERVARVLAARGGLA